MSLETSKAERPRGQRRRLLDDPLSIRALAHPLRLELQALIGRAGRITAADAARELNISHALASHHLRQLAKYGYLEQVAGADNRERPWHLIATSTSWTGVDATPEGAAAVAVLEQVIAERALEQLVDWQARRSEWAAGWREHGGVGRSTVYLTEAEFIEVADAIDAVLLAFIDKRPIDDIESRPAGSVPVDITCFAVPNDPPPAGD
jgi:DNA-binding MarR family transcriptional regulator